MAEFAQSGQVSRVLPFWESLPPVPESWPRHLVEEPRSDWPFETELVGNGPFVLAELDDLHVLLRANPRWYGPLS